jgi:flagellar hook-associated protein 2
MTSPIRISGFASGMDIDSMVSSLMKAERLPLDKLKQNKQTLEWQRDDYRSMNTLLLGFRSEVFNMRLSSAYRTKNTSSSDDTKVSATALTSAGAASYTITEVRNLASAATKVGNTISGSTKIDPTKSLYMNQSNYQQSSAFNWKSGSVESASITVTDPANINVFSSGNPNGLSVIDLANTTVKVNGTTFTYSATPTNPNEFSVDSTGKLTFSSAIAAGASINVNYIADKKVDTIPASTTATKTIQLTKGSIIDSSAAISLNNNDTGVTQYLSINTTITDSTNPNIRQLFDTGNGNAVVGTIDLNTGKMTMTDDVVNTEVTATYRQNYTSFGMTTTTSKGTIKQNFNIQGSESLNQVFQKLNDSNLGVSAFYDSFSDKVSITRLETGDYNTSGVEMDTSDSFLSTILGLSTAEAGGNNAQFTINGLYTERKTNTFDMNGVSFTLKQKFTTSDPSVTIGVSNNVDGTVDTIKKFVDKYNELIGKIQEKIQETRYKDYSPLTDDQMKELSDTQQEQWTDKAKSGLLRRDTILSGILDKMRSNFSTQVSNSNITSKYKSLSDLGITTSANYLDGGKLYIDEAKLRKALQDDPNAGEKLFTSTGSTSNEQGIAVRLYETINTGMDKIKQRAGNSYSTNQQFTLGKSLNDLSDRISAFEDRMQKVEDRYYRQFTAMEQAMNKANGQSASLMSLFSGN